MKNIFDIFGIFKEIKLNINLMYIKYLQQNNTTKNCNKKLFVE